MTRYSQPQIYDAAVKAGFSTVPQRIGADPSARYSPAEIIAAIAMGESGGDNQATANTSREYSVGVYQINLKAHTDITEADARDLNASSVYAYRLSQGGTNFTPWTIYKTGVYLNFLPFGHAPAPVSAGADPNYQPQGGTVAVNPGTTTVLGLTVPSVAELQGAALVASVALAAVFLVVVSVKAWVSD